MGNGYIQIPGYEILRPLGTGGMSTVYLALQRSLDRTVAIKVMRRGADAEAASSAQGEKRFLLEGRLMAKLPHRNIVAVYDIVSSDAVAYISMEYLDGGTLSDRMKTGLALADAVSVIVQIASALEFAHAHGVVHRDLKPANIMFRDSGTPVLTDFGIARYQDGSATRLTQTGMLVGTPTYMSPEQINGQQVDGRADLYSLGILFYELLAGTAPFQGLTPVAVLMAHLTQPPPPLSEEFRSFQPVLDRMLAKNCDERYASMKEFSDDLKARLVHSDTLLMRLQLDPNQTSSEQLRALGFHTSTPTGGSLHNSLLGSLSATPRPTPLPAALSGLPSSSARQSRLPWMWITAAAGAVLVAIGLWLVFGGRGHLDKDDEVQVRVMLEGAEHRIEANELMKPSGDSAFDVLQSVQQKDPDNAKAQELLDRIARKLAEQAQQSLAAGKLDEAAEQDSQALFVRPDDASLRTLKTQIEQARKTAQVKAQVQGLLERAQTARAAGRIFGDAGAYTLLAQAHALAPNDADVQKRLDAVVSEQLDTARKALAAGQSAQVSAELARLQPYLGVEPGFIALRGEADAMLKKQQKENSIVGLLQRGNQQLRAGHLAEPGGDNAYETLGELGKLAGGDKRIAEFGDALARALLADARKLDKGGQAPRALERAGLALMVAPGLTDAQTLKTQIEQRLGARAAKLAQTLSSAKQAIAEQRFVPPASDDAYTSLQTVLALDPTNTDARQLLGELPKRIVEAATARAQTNAAAAAAMVDYSRRIFVQDAALATLSRKLQAQLAAEKNAALAQAARDRIGKILAVSTPAPAQLRAGAKDLDDLLATDSANKDTLALRTRLIDALGVELQAAPGVAEFDALAALLKEQARPLSGDRAYAALVATLPALRAKVAQAETARAEAQRGELVLNAYPWGKVESVLDANRQPVPLPADATTPLVLTLPAGSYVVTFRHPKVGKPVRVIATVEARKRVVANAAFPTISAREYFSRAGW
ncbi:MAG: protein kinase domain-containing protein [Rudaea sp.]